MQSIDSAMVCRGIERPALAQPRDAFIPVPVAVRSVRWVHRAASFRRCRRRRVRVAWSRSGRAPAAPRRTRWRSDGARLRSPRTRLAAAGRARVGRSGTGLASQTRLIESLRSEEGRHRGVLPVRGVEAALNRPVRPLARRDLAAKVPLDACGRHGRCAVPDSLMLWCFRCFRSEFRSPLDAIPKKPCRRACRIAMIRAVAGLTAVDSMPAHRRDPAKAAHPAPAAGASSSHQNWRRFP